MPLPDHLKSKYYLHSLTRGPESSLSAGHLVSPVRKYINKYVMLANVFKIRVGTVRDSTGHYLLKSNATQLSL